MAHTCPACGSLIYSRRHPLCGQCGERLPDSVLFTPAERAGLETKLAEARRRAREAHQSPDPASPAGDASPTFFSTDLTL